MKNVADIYALSPMQQLMLLHAKTTGSEHDVLFTQIVYRITGPLDAQAYRQAWQLMVDRHATLRTIFVWQDGKDPVQVVREQVTLPWQEHDWRDLRPDEQERELDRLLAADRAAGFDLLRAPLMRAALVGVADDVHWLVWSSHHLIIDRWCIGIILAELKTAYEALSAGEVPALRPAPRYRDYIAWLAEQDEGAARAYWRTALQETTARPLPRHALTDQAPPELSSLELTVTDETPAALRRFARDHDLTIGTLIVAAWSLVLGAATGTDDTLFGLTVSGRPAELPDVGDTVGCFINNVPLRVMLDADAALVPWLQTLQENQLNLQPFEYASPAQIQAWSGQRSSGPLFDTLVVLQAPVPHAAPGGLTVEYVRGGMQTGYPLSLGVVPGANSIELELSYDRRRVSDRFVEQMASALQRALRAVPVDGSARLASLRAAVQMDGPLAPSGPAVETRGGDWEQPYTLPRTAAEQAMAQIWAEVLNLPRVGTEDNFFDVGGDSVRAIQLFTQIEERLGKSLPVSLLFNEPTVAHMAQALGDDVAGLDVDPILQPINPNGTRPPLFYVHGIFGDVLSITNLVPFLGADQPLYGLQAAGLSPGFEPDVTIEAMAARYVESIRRIQASGPYYLGGFCFGGVVAYEIARQLEHRGEETALLTIIEGMAPREFHNTRPVYHPQRLEILRQGTPYWARGNKEFGGWRLKERILSLMGRGSDASPNTNGRNGGALNDNLADFNAARPASQFALREINKRAVEEYVPPPYGGRVTLFRARCVHIKDALLGDVDPERGWGSVAQGGVSIVYVDGTHIGMLMEPHVAGLAATLARVLREAQERVQAAEK